MESFLLMADIEFGFDNEFGLLLHEFMVAFRSDLESFFQSKFAVLWLYRLYYIRLTQLLLDQLFCVRLSQLSLYQESMAHWFVTCCSGFWSRLT